MSIIEFLKDPINAIATLIGTVIVSMFGAFIKDGLLKLLSHSSKWWKSKREVEQKENDQIVENLINNPTYLTLYCTRTIISNIAVSSLLILLIGYPFILKATEFFSQSAQSTPNVIFTIYGKDITNNFIAEIFSTITLVVIALMTLLLTYRVSRRNLITLQATKMVHESIKSLEPKNEPSSEQDLSSFETSINNAPKSANTFTDAHGNTVSPLNTETESLPPNSETFDGNQLDLIDFLKINNSRLHVVNGKIVRIKRNTSSSPGKSGES
ncbi:hypothetical protein N3553_18445 [Pantoea dispersa]|uniref:hypothetical protein n=1 Tax=Pantoea dispersa TaxID=59814 RepID=UPI0021AEA763|nr:hypothetical protein [Pantoea dispersa]MCT6591853.1 hypothetical protein [Pantoea dispersa]